MSDADKQVMLDMFAALSAGDDTELVTTVLGP